MTDLPTWERRFRSPILSFPAWSADDPERMVVGSTESGSYQLYAWNRATGERRQVTFDPVGVLAGCPTRDGTGVVWFHDPTGAEAGQFVVAPFEEAAGAEPLFDGVPTGWSEGLALGARRSAVAISTADEYAVYVAEGNGPARRLAGHPQPIRLAGGAGMAGSMTRGALSADETILVLEVMEDGDVLHPALRALDAGTGEILAELRDEGCEVSGFTFSPTPGDQRMTVTRELGGERRPFLWNARTGGVEAIDAGLTGDVEPVDWWPDASAVLLQVLEAGRHRLYLYELETGDCSPLDTEPGSITAAAVRPDGEVWYRGHRGEHPARLLRAGAEDPILAVEGAGAPAGRAMEEWWFDNPDGDPVHGFIVRPDGDGPHPVILRVHGGPHSVDMDRWAPDISAHVDAGFLVAMVNYRGSEGFGQAWRDALTGNIGVYELEDVLAGLDDLVARGLADPARVALAGWSWGGYVTLMGAGRFPERFCSLVAGVPVADYVTAFEDEAPILQALDRALFGGSPDELPDLYRQRSPLTYADAVQAPLLILAGTNDSRCPIRQVWNYVDRLRERDVEPWVYTYDTGHSSFDIEERVRQSAIVLDFLAATVPGIRRLDGLDAHLAAAGFSPVAVQVA